MDFTMFSMTQNNIV